MSGTLERIKNFYNSQDTQDRVNVLINFFGDGFKILMASLLSIFVPQNCGYGDICSAEQNLSSLDDFNSFVVAFNFFTLATFGYLYYIELNRERWLISTFDHDDTKNDVFLKTFTDKYPIIFKTLEEKNHSYKKAYFIILVVYLLNVLFSAILIYNFFYLDYRSITVLLTNVTLCWSKILRGLQLAKQCCKENLAYSFYNLKHISFNVMDKTYLDAQHDWVQVSSV